MPVVGYIAERNGKRLRDGSHQADAGEMFFCPCSSVVEYVLGKDGVGGSIPLVGSTDSCSVENNSTILSEVANLRLLKIKNIHSLLWFIERT